MKPPTQQFDPRLQPVAEEVVNLIARRQSRDVPHGYERTAEVDGKVWRCEFTDIQGEQKIVLHHPGGFRCHVRYYDIFNKHPWIYISGTADDTNRFAAHDMKKQLEKAMHWGINWARMQTVCISVSDFSMTYQPR